MFGWAHLPKGWSRAGGTLYNHGVGTTASQVRGRTRKKLRSPITSSVTPGLLSPSPRGNSLLEVLIVRLDIPDRLGCAWWTLV